MGAETPRRYHLRAARDDAGGDSFCTIEAATPVAAAMQLFFQLHESWPEVIELERRDLAGYPLTTVRLSAREPSVSLRVEVEDRGLDD